MARQNSSGGRSRKRREPAPAPPTWDEILINSLIPWRIEIAGLLLFLLALITLLALLGISRWEPLLWWTGLLRQLAGWGAYPLALSMGVAGLHIVLRRVERPYTVKPSQIIGFELLLLAALPLSHQLLGADLNAAYLGQGGGLIGWALSGPLRDFLGPLLTLLFHLSLLGWGVALMLQIRWRDAVHALRQLSDQLRQFAREIEPADALPAASSTPPAQTRPDAAPIIVQSAPPPPRPLPRSPRLPPLDLLEKGTLPTLNRAEVEEKKRLIEQCLADFGLPAAVTQVRRGPAITQFGVQPGYIEREGPDGQRRRQKVRVGQIAALQRDLALVLAAPRLRIEAPVPGRGIVGIEVPNIDTNVVRLRALIESEPFRRLASPLALGLGWDVAGAPVVTDLRKLPHLLIAGATGSGKSVSMNAMITCLVFNNSPEQLRLVMIDPKKVELVRFNGLPHLIGHVEVEGERVIGVMRWLTAEMDRRYQLFSVAGARQLTDYNDKAARQEELEKLPYIVVLIDELADLMALYPGDVERTLCRLAQMARATGIHLVVATQRPSTDVITGLIKANFPARASFSVASSVDSRVILDSVGAEQLLGKGDMLFLPPDASAPIRVQGCFVNDREVENVVAYWQKALPDQPEEAPPWEELIARRAFIEEKDELLEQAIALIQKIDTVSTSLLQRRLRVGYPRAARLMETLYEMGLVEDPKEGGRTRRTFVDEENEDPLGDYLTD